jgi:hypothetical protein
MLDQAPQFYSAIRRQVGTGLMSAFLSFSTHSTRAGEFESFEKTDNVQPTVSDHWAFQSAKLPPIPPVKNRGWARNPIDHFVLAQLEAKGLAAAPEADRRTLVRRLSFDLLGLPPAPEVVETFINDQRSEAYEHLVDWLLASPHYGERWARHWLDLARFSESHGFEYDKPRDHAWRYRDYVIRSFNSDKPYPLFIREQLAGDVFEPITRDGIIASSFLVAGPWDEVANNQVGQLMKTRAREEELEDIVSAVAQTFLGLTVNCARCHAHKFDPIPQADYYRIKSVFEGVRYGDRPILTPDELQSRSNQVTRLKQSIGAIENQIAEIEQSARQMLFARRHENESDAVPFPLARWTFDSDAHDLIGPMHGTLEGGATVSNGRLHLDGKGACFRSSPLPRDVREKTLEVWLTLSNLTQQGGGSISLENSQGSNFDAIVFGERQPKKWTAGSSFFRRTRELKAPEESVNSLDLIHLAVVYRGDNSIALYRNGLPYSDAYTPTGEGAGLQTYAANDARVLLGLRHTGAGNGYLAGDIDEARLYDRALSAREIAASFRSGVSSITTEEIVQALSDDQRKQRTSLLAALQSVRDTLNKIPPVPLAYAGSRQQPAPTHRLVRGDVEKEGELVSPGALSIVPKPSPEFGLAPDAPESERRRKFAEWIGSSDHPLTARVMVNRIWQQHFGNGIVGTPSDLGVNGERPSHPELLDWLALQFIERGWRMKPLHRLIVTSSTYRQSSMFNQKAAGIDADNRLLWHFAPRRLEGEAVRDAILNVSSRLNAEISGPSFRPFAIESFGSVFYKLTDRDEPEFNRRSIYRMNVNSGKDPLLDVFDCPDPSFKTPLRRVTTTPLQALSLMNNSFVERQAKYFAERVIREAGGSLSAQVNRAYLLAFGREPNSAESRRGAALAKEYGVQSVCWVLLNASEFLYLK